MIQHLEFIWPTVLSYGTFPEVGRGCRVQVITLGLSVAEGKRGCRPVNFKALRVKKGRATEHKHILHNVELDPWGCHTYHVTAVNCGCVRMSGGLSVYAV